MAILDDHPVIGLGLEAHLRNELDIKVVHIETNFKELLEKLAQEPCDVALVDFYLPLQAMDGVGFIRRLRRHHPDMSIITFSAGKALETEYAAFRAGANGYASKQTQMATIVEMLRQVCVNPCAFLSVKNNVLHYTTPKHPDDCLTCAELEVFRNIYQGLSVTQVAAKLLRSKKTISTHKRRAMRKLGLADDLALALYLHEKFRKGNSHNKPNSSEVEFSQKEVLREDVKIY